MKIIALLILSLIYVQANADNCIGFADNPNHLLELIKETIETQNNLSDVNLYNVNSLKTENNLCLTKIELSNTMGFRAQVKANDRILYLTGKYDYQTSIPVFNKEIKQGDLISKHDIDNMYIPASKINSKHIIQDPKQIIGMKAKVSIKVASPIHNREITVPLLIEKNAPLHVIYQAKNLKLKMQAIALTNGSLGDIVSVRNARSNAILNAKVIGNNLVQIQMD
ncbi:flagellar basal body P-ring formation chaperone FlgA [Rickettsiales endosymbiont of Stachyamoeba lipophora]|uniref:flagellar basal body P-ring formation chaperone FlgA n=1 Tax=Rickettsiales endosymbiont of Stachyamoeba lipophora TaxID=2486578 RepID=UPI000F64CAAD|nr:flagellar basal body P-ring formation chaperone FlgA [Rickettsiales endosymbiont of Stachyamoeba lipophora]AZL15663.1 flagella basal body P-ring formation protein FlgA [Rickettsiales endosymbiont of Stachyamoeba lipophora]